MTIKTGWDYEPYSLQPSWFANPLPPPLPKRPPTAQQEDMLITNTPQTGRLLPSKRTRLVLDAGWRICARNVPHGLRRRPPRPHAAPHRRVQVVENLRRRSHRPPPATRRAPTVHGARSQDGGKQRARTRDGEAPVQEGGGGVETGGAPTNGEMERIRIRKNVQGVLIYSGFMGVV